MRTFTEKMSYLCGRFHAWNEVYVDAVIHGTATGCPCLRRLACLDAGAAATSLAWGYHCVWRGFVSADLPEFQPRQ